MMINIIKTFLAKFLQLKWHILGVKFGKYASISFRVIIIGECANLTLKSGGEITAGCFLVAREKIIIGNNSTVGYQTAILTTADPNNHAYPNNKLSKIYKRKCEPVIIGDNVWIGARSVILPGVKIGDCSVIAAGTIVNKDVPEYVLVAGVPGKIVKYIDKNVLNS
jgi:acetyltransferase-like isoleucine patch superfamily enzyme